MSDFKGYWKNYEDENYVLGSEEYCAQQAWKHQQAKIDELKKPRSLDEMAINQLAQANQVWRTKCDDLENRIHDAELQIAVHWGADEDTDSVLRDVEKALRGAND